MRFLEQMNAFVISPAVILMLGIVGIYFLVYLQAFVFRHPCVVVKGLFKQQSSEGVSSFRALTVALAGTLGVGNIVGVASAILAGGAGVMFWMWISALLSMLLKYSEVVLAMLYRQMDKEGKWHGGAYFYLHFLKCGKILAPLFAIGILLTSFFLGNAIQSNAAAVAVKSAFGVPRIVTGGILSCLVLMILLGGFSRVSSVTGILIPICSGGYLATSLAILALEWRALPSVFQLILREAFSFSAFGAGVGGYCILRSLRYGVTRGLLSTEAGCGTAPIAHACAGRQSAVEQGFFGLFEVVADLAVCTATGVVLLVAKRHLLCCPANGMEYAIAAYQVYFGAVAQWGMAVAVCVFAFATILGWSYYGSEALHYLGAKRIFYGLYTILYALGAGVFSFCQPEQTMIFADLTTGILTLVNLIGVCAKSQEIRVQTERYLKRHTTRKSRRHNIKNINRKIDSQ